MEPDQQLRNLRDFLLVYNRMTETCFQRCSSNFNYRSLTMDEERCVDNCAGKLIRSNHRLMGTYVQLMPRMVQRRMEEMESKAAEMAKAAENAAAATGAVETAKPEAMPEFQPPLAPSELEMPSPLLKLDRIDEAGATAATPIASESETLRAAALNLPSTAEVHRDSGSLRQASLSGNGSTEALTVSKAGGLDETQRFPPTPGEQS